MASALMSFNRRAINIPSKTKLFHSLLRPSRPFSAKTYPTVDPPNSDDDLPKILNTCWEITSHMLIDVMDLPPNHPQREEFLEACFENPFVKEGSKCVYNIKHDEKGLHVRADMPGADDKSLKLWIDNEGRLCFSGEEGAEKYQSLSYGNNKEPRRKFSSAVHLPPYPFRYNFNFDKIKGHIKNGVLRIVVPVKSQG